MAAHAVGEGAGVGVSYSGDSGWSQGLLVTLAIGLHNVPEGLAVSTVLISRGVPLRRAVLWNFASAIPQAIVGHLVALAARTVGLWCSLRFRRICLWRRSGIVFRWHWDLRLDA